MTEGDSMSNDSMSDGESMDDGDSMTEGESMEETENDSGTDTEDTSGSGPGFTAAPAVIALVGAALFAARQRE